MAPVIWGLDLKEMQWWKFKGSYMFNHDYHLRRSKMIVYQIAMIFCVVSESLGTAALSDYVKEQSRIQKLHSSALVHNDDFIGVASYNIFVGIYVATIFGAGFFFDLFWPERHESKSVRLAWKICAVLACIMGLADALALTIIVATKRSTITANSADALLIAMMDINPPLVYRHNARAIASVVFLWPGWVATVASTYILWVSHIHDDQYGPKTAHLRREEKDLEMRHSDADTPIEHANGERANNAPVNGAATNNAMNSEAPPTEHALPAAQQSNLSAYKSGNWSETR